MRRGVVNGNLGYISAADIAIEDSYTLAGTKASSCPGRAAPLTNFTTDG